MELLSEKYEAQMHGVLNCYDRIVIAGHLQPLSYAKGMTKYLYNKQIRIFDCKDFALPSRDLVLENAAAVAQVHGVEIEFVTKSHLVSVSFTVLLQWAPLSLTSSQPDA